MILDNQSPQIENLSPYALCGDTNNLPNACAGLTFGLPHTVQAVPYNGSNATGYQGAPLKVSFTLTR